MKIQEVIRTINQMKADGVITNYAIGGAVGATFYLEPVSTLDVDVFFDLHAAAGTTLLSLEPLYSYLRKQGGKTESEHILIADWPVQFLPATGRLIKEALVDAAVVDVEGVPARVFTAEYLAAIALQTGRAKDKARVLQFLEEKALDLTKFENLIQRHGLTENWRQFRQQFLE